MKKIRILNYGKERVVEDRWIIQAFFRRALGEEALNHLDIKVAEHAFVKIHDYYGLQFLRRLQQFQVILHVIVVLFQRFLLFLKSRVNNSNEQKSLHFSNVMKMSRRSMSIWIESMSSIDLFYPELFFL